ncbi:proline-rich protein PRCC [Melanaphis sacchari]|uniref:proline-rich protein PRCC n=1 Tax=Melanaphis sacchari TaxID=742174 RepID=UPI000DC15348|nr:proline-rich protein PRCC [Melanaphis sacchari]XP_025199602.1 proline-rich protein PRCC [Melanaphis sacchari]XP_025199603.1 proline-rich protein PRCC [Melanaphis sacchari]
MSLVAYADSDCDSDDDNGEEIKPSLNVEKVVTNKIGSKPFLSLPEPKSFENVKTIDDYDSVVKEKPVVHTKLMVNSFQEKKEIPLFPTLPKPKTGGKVKIMVSSLNEFYDEDDDYQPKCKIMKPSNSGCGLFSMLPDPKNKKTSKASTTISMVPRATMRTIKNNQETLKPKTTEIKCFETKPIEVEDGADDDDDQEDGDFLGLNKINEVLDVAPIAGFDLPEIQTNTTIIEDDDRVYGPVYCSEPSESDLYEEDETKLILDSNALKQLSDPGKTQIKQVEVINVDMRQVLEESQQWLQKNMTEEYAESKNVSSDINISGQSKRKHQITYLAQQAKANELKLKNMWAENRMTRKQTQAKYGF